MKNPLLALGLAALGLLLFFTAPAALGANNFSATGPLATTRSRHTATLPNGKVLIAASHGTFSRTLSTNS